MKSTRMWKALALCLVLALLSTSVVAFAEEDYVELVWLNCGTAINEKDVSLVTAEAAKRTGIFVQYHCVPNEKFSVLMASGDMEADIISVSVGDRQPMIEGNLIIPLDDLLDEYGPHIKETLGQKTIDYLKKYLSYGKDAVYLLTSHQTTGLDNVSDFVPYNYQLAPYIRWDYYEELGSPEITNEDELLDVLRQMQDAHPTNDAGRKTYAMSLDVTNGLWSYATMYFYVSGYLQLNPAYICSYDTNYELTNIFEDDYVLWNALRYYNKAWQLGILDPETFTQKGENVNEKITTGQSFYTENSWNSYNVLFAEQIGGHAGFEPVLEAFPCGFGGDMSQFGWAFATGISSKSEHPVEAIKFLDFLYSDEGARLMYSGIEGIHWAYDENGVPAFTQETLENRGKAEWDKANGLSGKFSNWIGIDNMVPASDGYPVDLKQTTAMLKAANTELDTYYSSLYGVEYPGQVGKVLEDKGVFKNVWWNTDYSSLMQVVPDDITRIATKATDIMLKAFPRMIMSDTTEEFEEERDKCVEQLKEIDVQQIVDWVSAEWERSKAELSTLDN